MINGINKINCFKRVKNIECLILFIYWKYIGFIIEIFIIGNVIRFRFIFFIVIFIKFEFLLNIFINIFGKICIIKNLNDNMIIDIMIDNIKVFFVCLYCFVL